MSTYEIQMFNIVAEDVNLDLFDFSNNICETLMT